MSDDAAPTPQELRDRIVAERAGIPFLVYRAVDGQRLLTLGDAIETVTIGRADGCEVQLDLDPEISRLHAELRRMGEDWVIADDGLSRNGTFVNDERLTARRRLLDGDVVRCGSTRLGFHDPRRGAVETRAAADRRDVRLSESQRRVLVALCRPLTDGSHALPAGNQQIAEELHLSLSGVKSHLRTLFDKLGVDDGLPHNRKRAQLAEHAVQSGVIRMAELRD